MSGSSNPSRTSADAHKPRSRHAGIIPSLAYAGCAVLFFYCLVCLFLSIPVFFETGSTHAASWKGSRAARVKQGAPPHDADVRDSLIRTHSFRTRGTSCRITYAIGRREEEEAKQAFGYSEQEFRAYLNAVIRDFNARYRWKTWAHLVGKNGYVFFALPGYGSLREELKSTYGNATRSFLESHYFKINHENVISVDFPAVQLWQAPRVKHLYRMLLSQARLRHMNEREFASFIAAFVQGFTYRIPPETQNGRFINGVWLPVTCLREMAGDCDTKSLLFATLFYHYHRKGSIMILTDNHALIGIRNQHCILPGDRKVTLHGQDYILLETTNYFDFGDISPEVWSHIQRKHSRYVAFN
jgi:hypothetical protein